MAKANKKQEPREEVNAPPADRPELTIEEVKALWDGIDFRQKGLDVEKWKLAKALFSLAESGVGRQTLAVKLDRSVSHVNRYIHTWREHKDRPGIEHTSFMDAYYAIHPPTDPAVERKNRTKRDLQNATDNDLKQIVEGLSPRGRARLKKVVREFAPDDESRGIAPDDETREFDTPLTDKQAELMAEFAKIAHDPGDPVPTTNVVSIASARSARSADDLDESDDSDDVSEALDEPEPEPEPELIPKKGKRKKKPGPLDQVTHKRTPNKREAKRAAHVRWISDGLFEVVKPMAQVSADIEYNADKIAYITGEEAEQLDNRIGEITKAVKAIRKFRKSITIKEDDNG